MSESQTQTSPTKTDPENLTKEEATQPSAHVAEKTEPKEQVDANEQNQDYCIFNVFKLIF